MANVTVWTILEYAIKTWTSDIHITEWKPLTFRIDWKLKVMDQAWIIDSVKVKQILLELLNEDKVGVKKFLEEHDLDFAYIYKDWTSFRCNAFYKLWKISFVLRRIANEAMKIEQLWLPPAVEVFTKLKQWLILVTWPTGSGKSTSMVAILEKINEQRGEHILTIEDPVEFVFKDKKSVFSQREVWRDTESFSTALRAAMREDPDIVMVWELRDTETVKAALELAETGHLVISTLHTSSAVQTINRLLSFFPLNSQNAIRDKLADALKWVLSQRLIPKVWGWRIGIYELMFVNTWIKNLIRSGTMNQVQWNIETWTKYWMVTMQKFADNLRDQWLVLEKDYINYFKEDADLDVPE